MSLNLSAEEQTAFDQLFKIADKQDIGVITGEEAVPFLEKSGLAPQVLGQIWQIADAENRGFLTFSGFVIAMRLVALAQEKLPFDYKKSGKIPYFADIHISGVDSSKFVQLNRPNNVSSGDGSDGSFLPPISSDEMTRYQQMFTTVCPTDGLMDGDRASSIFGRAPLSTEILARVWNLVDTHKRGALDIREFNTGMHIINLLLNGSLKSPPVSISPSFIASAASTSSVSAPSQYPGLSRSPPVQAPNIPVSDPWAIPSQDLTSFCQLFSNVDKAHKGYVSGSEAYSFFLASKLPEDVLAQIWDLSDTNNNGKLNIGEFCISLYLIKLKLSGKELPKVLPSSMLSSVAPLMQKSKSVPTSIPSVVPANISSPNPNPTLAPNPTGPSRVTSGTEDLLSLDATPFSPTLAPQHTSSNATKHSAPPVTKSAPFPVVSPLQLNHTPGFPTSPAAKPNSPTSTFFPQSSFGQTIAKNTMDKPSAVRTSVPSQLAAPIPQVASSEQLKLAAEVPKLESQLSQVKKSNDDLQKSSRDVAANLSDVKAKVSEIRKAYDEELAKAKQISLDIETNKAQTEQVNREYSILEATLNALQKQNKQKGEVLEQVVAEAEAAKNMVESSNASIQQLKSEVADKEQTLAQLHLQLDEMTQRLVSLDEESKAVSQRKLDLEYKINNSKTQLATATEEYHEHSKQLEAEKQELSKLEDGLKSVNLTEEAPKPEVDSTPRFPSFTSNGITTDKPTLPDTTSSVPTQHNSFDAVHNTLRSPSLNSNNSSAHASTVSRNPFHNLKISGASSPVSNFWESEFASAVFPRSISKTTSLSVNNSSVNPSLDSEPVQLSNMEEPQHQDSSVVDVSTSASQRGSPVLSDLSKLTGSARNTAEPVENTSAAPIENTSAPTPFEISNKQQATEPISAPFATETISTPAPVKPPVPPSRRDRSAQDGVVQQATPHIQDEFPPIQFNEIDDDESSSDEEPQMSNLSPQISTGSVTNYTSAVTELPDPNHQLEMSTTTHVQHPNSETIPSSTENQYFDTTSGAFEANSNTEVTVNSNEVSQPFDFDTANESDNDDDELPVQQVVSGSLANDAFNVDDEFDNQFANLQAAEIKDDDNSSTDEEEHAGHH